MWFFNDLTSQKSKRNKCELPRTRDDIVVEFDEDDSANASRVSLPGLPRGAKRIPCETCKGHLGCKVILDPPTASTVNGLQRLNFFLTCFGLLYTRKKRQKVSYSMLYSIFICFLCAVNFLRFFAAYSANEAYGSKLFLKVKHFVVCFVGGSQSHPRGCFPLFAHHSGRRKGPTSTILSLYDCRLSAGDTQTLPAVIFFLKKKNFCGDAKTCRSRPSPPNHLVKFSLFYFYIFIQLIFIKIKPLLFSRAYLHTI